MTWRRSERQLLEHAHEPMEHEYEHEHDLHHQHDRHGHSHLSATAPCVGACSRSPESSSMNSTQRELHGDGLGGGFVR